MPSNTLNWIQHYWRVAHIIIKLAMHPVSRWFLDAKIQKNSRLDFLHWIIKEHIYSCWVFILLKHVWTIAERLPSKPVEVFCIIFYRKNFHFTRGTMVVCIANYSIEIVSGKVQTQAHENPMKIGGNWMWFDCAIASGVGKNKRE